MKLDGGIKDYCSLSDVQNQEQSGRYKTNEPPFGRKVKYLNANGRDWDRYLANKYFTTGQILTVKEIYVGSWCSDVEFVEVLDVKFNTVMFADVED